MDIRIRFTYGSVPSQCWFRPLWRSKREHFGAPTHDYVIVFVRSFAMAVCMLPPLSGSGCASEFGTRSR